MKTIYVFLFLAVFALPPTALPALADTASPAAETVTPATIPAAQADCQAALERLDELDTKVSRELRMIKRDIAALSQMVEEPGMKEAFAGIGYILGLFGVAAFMASRKHQRSTDK